MSEEDGGLVAELIKQYKMAIFRCTCGFLIESPNFEGYTHSGGFQDKLGSKWWLYVKCPACDYDWAIRKIEKRCQKLQSENHQSGRFELFFKECEAIHKNRLLNGEDNVVGSVCNLYTIDYTGRKVINTPIVTFDHSPMNHVKDMVKRLSPACYVVVLNAWQSLKPLKDGNPVDKTEVLWVAGRSKEGGFAQTETWEVVRNLEGKVTKFENLKQTVISEKLP